ncbi:protein FAR1-RELATED SEQUENCE 5-like [Cornus florida]|uniref:protein FAR1-RELATED SEQUENCE 5-like n=1 Tax=Cornus florida TaxID=4283 RepID=UPI002899FEC8|nr:protein FAR1-RELATED SEQUENCE 5-like [Cornus florida]
MKFETEEEAYDFYNSYVGRVDFSIRKEYFNKSKKTGKLSSRLLTCCKEGFRGDDIRNSNTKTPRAETRTGCLARMLIQVSKYTYKFEFTKFVESHNHPLMIDECMHMLPSQHRISRVHSIDLELASESGISPRNSYELMGRQAGGKESIGDQMITNIFWVDSKMIVDYCNFGDVVSFDTTYKVIHGNRQFGSFLGLNHHRETAVFGVAFMYDETAESFIWLFEIFLKAMSGKAPKTIFTDQDATMGKALMQVMPGTKHYLCVWHLMQNAQKHLGFLFRRAQGFKKMLSKLMFQIEEEEEFTREWNLMITEYGVVGNIWFTNLLGLKHRWAMTFIKRAWSAGIHSTQLSESFNSCLKAYLSSQLILLDFFTHFERLLSDKRYKEYVAENGLLHNLPQLKTNCNILVQAANLYTKVIFNSFQEEFLAASASQRIIGCSPIEGNGGCVYKVVGEDGMQCDVTRTSEDELLCSCCKFEKESIMCRHSLKILNESMFANTLPRRYILKRWTKSVRDGSLEENLSGEVIVDAEPKIEVRRRHRNCNEGLQSGEAGASTHSGTIPYHVLVNGCEIPIEFLNEDSYMTPPQRLMHQIRFSQPPGETFVADLCNSNTNYSYDDYFSDGFRIDKYDHIER